MKEEWAKDLVVQPWCISEVVKAHEDCPELQAVLDEYHKPVVIQDQVLGELTLDKDYDAFEGEIQWCGKDVSLSLEVNAESKPSWTRARSAAKKLLADCETWDKAMRDLAAKNLTELANNWLSRMRKIPATGNRPHHRGRTCPADQYDQPVRHLRRQLHRLV